mmetsp:Transcript_49591/g.97232  ORF Transcript_49591/g.97232 Transcript_49591/m.97232 type:complete len:796 (+) Transcript_49591:71-2458(+)|eukprot:CAMPEP_0175136736 /NCGR_PEP_ID=MMETSP0087-20121206/9440_1 /TAXON_ID=136419 /ORGANISM="Unknown Unknown, Strain D1" /LENGTH=795 /DNA_ID=CAMNT_0016419523 /DNA_START=71 /DNA_END=2458 /DNA_ORIENTATION=-
MLRSLRGRTTSGDLFGSALMEAGLTSSASHASTSSTTDIDESQDIVEEAHKLLKEFKPDSQEYWEEVHNNSIRISKHSEATADLLHRIGENFHFDDHSSQAYSDYLAKYGGDLGGLDTGCTKVLAALSDKRKELDQAMSKWKREYQQVTQVAQSVAAVQDGYNKLKLKHEKKAKKYLSMTTATNEARLGEKDSKIAALRTNIEMKRLELFLSMHSNQAHQHANTLTPLASVLRGYLDFFKQGYELIAPLEKTVELLEGKAQEKSSQVSHACRLEATARSLFHQEYHKEHAHSTSETSTPGLSRDLQGVKGDTTTIAKQGYLYVRTPHFARVWVELRDGFLNIHSSPRQVLPVLLCTVRESVEGKLRFLFEVISAGNQPILLQAECRKDVEGWLAVIQNAISHQLNNQTSGAGPAKEPTAEELQKERDLKTLRAVEGNSVCADCQGPDPVWVSLNLGILVCLNCSGFHRSLGVHISQVRSLKMDKIDPFRMEYLTAVGNAVANSIWEENLDTTSRPEPDAPRDQWEVFIRSKYMERAWTNPARVHMDESTLLEMLTDSLRAADLKGVLRALAWGAGLDSATVMLTAVQTRSTLLTDALLHNGGQLNGKDENGWTPLHWAAKTGIVGMAELLLQRGGRELLFAKDNEGRLPVQLAVFLHKDTLPNPSKGRKMLSTQDGEEPPPPPPSTEEDSKAEGGGGGEQDLPEDIVSLLLSATESEETRLQAKLAADMESELAEDDSDQESDVSFAGSGVFSLKIKHSRSPSSASSISSTNTDKKSRGLKKFGKTLKKAFSGSR